MLKRQTAPTDKRERVVERERGKRERARVRVRKHERLERERVNYDDRHISKLEFTLTRLATSTIFVLVSYHAKSNQERWTI